MNSQRSFRRRQGMSLKKLNAYDLRKNITQAIRVQQQEETQKLSSKNSKNQSNNISKKKIQYKSLKESRHKSYDEHHQQFTELKKTNTKDHRKFKPLLNAPITKIDQNVEKLCDQIIPKAKCFFRFGIKSYQKSSHKRIFSDVLNLPAQDMKGSIFIGQLWNNNMTSKYLKLNKIKTHKSKLFQKLKDLKWQRIKKQRQKDLDSSHLITSVRQFSLNSKKSIQSISHIDSLLSLKHFNSTMQEDLINQSHGCYQKSDQTMQNTKRFQQSLEMIRSEINQEYKKCKEQDYWKNMKSLQKQSVNMHRMWDKYLQNALEMN